MNSKKWYKSKAIWAGVIGVVVATLTAVDQQFGTGIMSSKIAAIILSVTSTLGIYGRTVAKTEIK